MPLNLKKLQSAARRRIGLKGDVQFKSVPKSRLTTLRIGSGFLSTSTNSSTLKHTIVYSDASSLDPTDVYHEFCRAKFNECGFTTIELAALDTMKECSKEDPKYILDANSAIAVVSEVYTSALLFSKFEEASQRRETIVMRFESDDALTNLHTEMGFWGTGAICYYKNACERARADFPQKQIEKAFHRSKDSKELQKEYEQINNLLADLPKIDLLTMERISDTDSISIVDVIVRLFATKTGLEC